MYYVTLFALVSLPEVASSVSTWRLLFIPQDPVQMSPYWWGSPTLRRCSQALLRLCYNMFQCIQRSVQTRRGSLMNLPWHPEQGLAHSRLSLNVCWMDVFPSEWIYEISWGNKHFSLCLSSLPCRQTHLWMLVSFFSPTLCADCTRFGALPWYRPHWLRVKAYLGRWLCSYLF